MNAGRELDARVAKIVFGRTMLSLEEMEAEAKRVWAVQPDCRYFHMGFSWSAIDGFHQDFPACSTEIAAAMGVVRAMARRGFDFECGVKTEGTYALLRHYERPTNEPPDVFVVVDPRQVSEKADQIDALPLAICIAALKAVEP